MKKTVQQPALPTSSAFFSLINNSVKLKLYLLKNLPAAYFSGLKITDANASSCTVSIPYKWFTKNPFRSAYFACLSMAAEFSTGVLAMAHVYKKKPAVSMLVTGLEAKFHKKVTGLSFFTCNEGDKFKEAIQTAITSGASQEVIAHSVGVNAANEIVAEFWVKWSFKMKH